MAILLHPRMEYLECLFLGNATLHLEYVSGYSIHFHTIKTLYASSKISSSSINFSLLITFSVLNFFRSTPSAVGRPDRVEKYMGSSWSSGNPDVVLDDQALYNDILRRCNQLELTLMLNTSRPLKIQEVRPAVENVLRQGMERLSGSTPLQEEDSTALKNFVHQIDGKLFFLLSFFLLACYRERKIASKKLLFLEN